MSTEDRESISADELEQALKEYVDKANASPRAQKTLAGWTCRVHIEAVDVDEVRFTYVVDRAPHNRLPAASKVSQT